MESVTDYTTLDENASIVREEVKSLPQELEDLIFDFTYQEDYEGHKDKMRLSLLHLRTRNPEDLKEYIHDQIKKLIKSKLPIMIVMKRLTLLFRDLLRLDKISVDVWNNHEYIQVWSTGFGDDRILLFDGSGESAAKTLKYYFKYKDERHIPQELIEASRYVHPDSDENYHDKIIFVPCYELGCLTIPIYIGDSRIE